MMDNTAGVIKLLGADKVRYINIAVDIRAQCDCVPSGGHPLVPDQEILYSADPVTVDQASRDLLANAKGLPGNPAETGIRIGPPDQGTHIEENPATLESGNEKLDLFSLWIIIEPL